MYKIRRLFNFCHRKIATLLSASSEDLIEHSHQTISNFFDGFGWTLGAYAIDCISLDTTWTMYLIKSLMTGTTSCTLACGTNYILKKFRSKTTPEIYQTSWDDIASTFLSSACWQGAYDLASIAFKQQFLYLFASVGLLSTVASSLPFIYKYTIHRLFLNQQEFNDIKKYTAEDIKSLFITFVSCGAFVATSTPTNNFFYTETGYDTKASDLGILLDMLRSGLVDVVSYAGVTLLISTALMIKRSLTQKSEDRRYLLAGTDSNNSLSDSFSNHSTGSFSQVVIN